MHVKSDSEATSLDASTPPRSPRRPLYYVQSPSQHDVEKMSYGSSPMGSPTHHYHCSPIHHSRESSTSRFSASLKHHHHHPHHHHRKKVHGRQLLHDDNDDLEELEEEEGIGEESGHSVRFYVVCFIFSFTLLFTLFSLILWGASKSYKPHILVKNMVFENFGVQAGMDDSGVPTDMLSLNSTVRILYRNPATFFGVHVTSTPFQLYYYQLQVASGQMKPFYQRRKTGRNITTVVQARQVPLYGSLSLLGHAGEVQKEKVTVALNLTFMMRSRAYILGKLVKSKFYSSIRCPVTLDGTQLGKPLILKDSCTYE
ncbi:hypothetical protein Ancab_017290 [Ancistrocladus abbreviatus]